MRVTVLPIVASAHEMVKLEIRERIAIIQIPVHLASARILNIVPKILHIDF